MHIQPLAVATQAAADEDPSSPTLMLALLAGGLAMAAVAGAVSAVRRRREDADLLGLIHARGFDPIDDHDELARVAQRVEALFGELAMYARHLRLVGVLRVERSRYVLDAAHVILGIEGPQSASNANLATLNKLVLIAHGMDAVLPDFSLAPNHFLFKQVHPDPVFNHSGAFGRRNLVLGADAYHIAHVLGGEVRSMLAGNRDLVIESRGGVLAFYLHDERVQPKRLAAFVERVESLAEAMLANAGSWSPDMVPPPEPAPLLGA